MAGTAPLICRRAVTMDCRKVPEIPALASMGSLGRQQEVTNGKASLKGHFPRSAGGWAGGANDDVALSAG